MPYNLLVLLQREIAMKSLDVAIAVFALGLFSSSGLALASSPAQEREPSGTAETNAEATVSSVAQEDAQGVAESLHHKDRALYVMDEPLDGRSIETFRAGLEKLDQEASEKEYRNVMSALDYLLFYDLGAKRSKAMLYSRLDGKSPNQILEKVNKTRKNKGR